MDSGENKGAPRILIVEDDLDLTVLIDHVIRSIDPTIVADWVTSAERAVALIYKRLRTRPERPYDLIMTDVFLEGSSTGLDLWRLCAAHLPRVPLVLTSALPLTKLINSLGQTAAKPLVLAKPFFPDDCRELLLKLLGPVQLRRHFTRVKNWMPQSTPRRS